MRILLRVMGAAVLGLALAGGIAADAAAQDAQTLFDRGLKAMLDEQYETGCADIEQSYQLDPQPGALFTLAACYERWGKLQTAARHYERFLGQARGLPPTLRAKQEKRIANANDKLAELRPRVPKLQIAFDVPPPDDVLVTLDGKSIPNGELLDERRVDPGEHVIEVRTAEGGLERAVVRLEAGESRTITLALPGGAGEGGETDVQDDRPGGWTGMHTAAVLAGGIGIVGVVIGSVTGGMVFAKKGEVDDNCVESVCTPEGKAAADDGKSLATVSTATFVVGGVGLAAGVVLWLMAPSLDAPAEDSAGIGLLFGSAPGDPSSALLGVRGSF